MTPTETLAELHQRGVSLEPHGDRLRYRAPEGELTPKLREAMAENKTEILSALRSIGDGQAPPLDRPPATQQELRSLVDHLAEPEAFTRWLEWAMTYTDRAEY